jgi:hypothetical protein
MRSRITTARRRRQRRTPAAAITDVAVVAEGEMLHTHDDERDTRLRIEHARQARFDCRRRVGLGRAEARPWVQSGARRHGISGIYGNSGILESATCRIQRVMLGSNPTLSARLRSPFGRASSRPALRAGQHASTPTSKSVSPKSAHAGEGGLHCLRSHLSRALTITAYRPSSARRCLNDSARLRWLATCDLSTHGYTETLCLHPPKRAHTRSPLCRAH